VQRSDARRPALFTTSNFLVLRRPVESAQYCSYAYQKKLQAYGLRPSMSGKGNCYDNAFVETFFKP
jgi:putative transposase